MKLAEQLKAIADASAEKIPAATREIMKRNTAQLVESGAAGRAPGIGDPAPTLALPGPDGELELGELLANGPLVLTWFRGNW